MEKPRDPEPEQPLAPVEATAMRILIEKLVEFYRAKRAKEAANDAA